jgi:hypothetical protein
MKITLDWLNRYRTPRNGFTRAQVEALGLRWPPKPKGWLRRLVGQHISDEAARKFEAGRDIRARPLWDNLDKERPIWDQYWKRPSK